VKALKTKKKTVNVNTIDPVVVQTFFSQNPVQYSSLRVGNYAKESTNEREIKLSRYGRIYKEKVLVN
jgi:hypothetical protein